MNLRAILEPKLGSDNTVKLGESNLSKLSEVAIEDDLAQIIQDSLLSITEAENSPTIVSKNKDKWHKEAKKQFMDSIDSTLADHLELLGGNVPTETKDKSKGILTAYKSKLDSLAQELALLKKEGVSDAESKAMIKAKEDEIADLKKNYVPATEIQTYKTEAEELKRELEAFKKSTLREKVTGAAIKSGILGDFNSDIVDELVWGAVKKYTETEVFGTDKSKAKLMIDKATKQVVVRNSSDETMAIVSDSSVLTLEDLVKKSLIKYGLNKKNDKGNEIEFKIESGKKDTIVPILSEKYF